MTGRMGVRRRQPDHVMLLLLASIIVVTWLAGARSPNALTSQLAVFVAWGYYLLLAIGALTGWLSVFWRGRLEYALMLELASRWALCIGTLVYALAVFGIAGPRGALTVGFLLAWSGTSAWRIVNILTELHSLRNGAAS